MTDMDEIDFGELYRQSLNGGAPVEHQEGDLEIVVELRGSERTWSETK